MVDYINRGEKLFHMSLYEYCATIYKTKLNDEEKKKLLQSNSGVETRKSGHKPQPRYLFNESHPQSETFKSLDQIRLSQH